MENNLNIQVTAYKTIVRKEVLRFSRIWKQTLIPPVITNILYFIIYAAITEDLLRIRLIFIDSILMTTLL